MNITTETEASATAADIRNLIVMDTQFGRHESTDLTHADILRLEALGWVAEGHENFEYYLTDEGRAVVWLVLEGFTRFVSDAGRLLQAIDEAQRIAIHIGRAVQYIEAQYPGAQTLNAGPIMRSMRRWHKSLTASVAAAPQPSTPEPLTFADTDPEAGFIADAERLNCPACGGSGHAGDVQPAGDWYRRMAEAEAGQYVGAGAHGIPDEPAPAIDEATRDAHRRILEYGAELRKRDERAAVAAWKCDLAEVMARKPEGCEEPAAADVEGLAALIADELARIDGYDPEDQHGGLYDLRWVGGSEPEPAGDAWTMDYLPKAERIARSLAARQPEQVPKPLHDMLIQQGIETVQFANQFVEAMANGCKAAGLEFDANPFRVRNVRAEKAEARVAELEARQPARVTRPVGEMDRTAPPKVWLQIDPDGDAEDRSEAIPRAAWGDLTWCYESIGGQEVVYIRDDLATQPAPAAAVPEPLPMATAPRDGTMVRLLVEFDEHDLEDGEGPTWTIGAVTNDEPDAEFQFAGWCWSHDHFTEGKGRPIGWLPMLAAAAKAGDPCPQCPPGRVCKTPTCGRLAKAGDGKGGEL